MRLVVGMLVSGGMLLVSYWYADTVAFWRSRTDVGWQWMVERWWVGGEIVLDVTAMEVGWDYMVVRWLWDCRGKVAGW